MVSRVVSRVGKSQSMEARSVLTIVFHDDDIDILKAE